MLTDKTLREIYDLQTGMLRHPANRYNSSAIGAGQFVRGTLFKDRYGRGTAEQPGVGSVAQQMGLSPDERFTPELQLRMIDHLIRRRGRSAGGLGNEWEGLKRFSHPTEILSAYDARQRMLAGPRAAPEEWRGMFGGARAQEPASRPGDDLMQRGRAAGVLGDSSVTHQGNVSVDLNLNGFPRGLKSRATMDGIVGSVKLNTGSTMTAASDQE
jgi:hypothetical protein